MRQQDHVNARTDISGLETTARRRRHVQGGEFGTAHLKSVFVLRDSTGLEICVKFNLNVAAGNVIINYQINVSVLENQNGMEANVFDVRMESCGTNPLENAYVLLVLLGRKTSVL